MKDMVKKAIKGVVSVGITFAVLAPAWAWADDANAQSQSGRMGSMNAEKQAKLRAMSDRETLDVGGRKMTKSEMTAAMARGGSREPGGPAADLSAVQAKFQRERRAEIEAQNAQVMAKLAIMRQNAARFSAIRQEAMQLNNRARGAAPGDAQNLEKRAGELLNDLKQIGYQ